MTDEGPAAPAKPPEEVSGQEVATLDREIAKAVEERRAYITAANKVLEALDRSETALVKSFVFDCIAAPVIAAVACVAFYTMTTYGFLIIGGQFPALITKWFASLVIFLPPILAIVAASLYVFLRFRNRRRRRVQLRNDAEEAREKFARDLAGMEREIEQLGLRLRRARNDV